MAKAIVEDLKYEHMRELTVSGGRIGGRPHDVVRAITCEVGLLPRVHGSALFTRGETQALVAVTLGTSDDEQRIELLSGKTFKRFMLHYNFPPSASARPSRSAARAAARSATARSPSARCADAARSEEFPYTIRIVSEILESNGSSSMARSAAARLA